MAIACTRAEPHRGMLNTQKLLNRAGILCRVSGPNVGSLHNVTLEFWIVEDLTYFVRQQVLMSCKFNNAGGVAAS
eukprot:726017-Heterocapsa_arctica.AAC.1